MAGPLYIAEVAPKSIRGALTSLVGPGIALGLLTGNVTNFGLAKFDNGWRVSALLVCVFGSIYTVGLAFIPRTPRYVIYNIQIFVCTFTCILLLLFRLFFSSLLL